MVVGLPVFLCLEPYKVKIVKQPKPKVAPDYKPEDFETGPLPWEERALKEPPPPPVDPEDPILVPEEVPEFLEAVDPLPESEVPDLEETGIPLPSPKLEEEEASAPTPEVENPEEEETEDQPETSDIEAVVEETERIVEEMEQNRLAEQLLSGVQNMVDPNASVEQQLLQMRAQLAALAQLPVVIQNTLELVTRQLTNLTHQESQINVTERQSQIETTVQSQERLEESEIQTNGIVEEVEECKEEQETVAADNAHNAPVIVDEETKPSMTEEEREKLKKEEKEMLEEQQRIEKQKKIEIWNEVWPWGNTKSYCRQYRINFMKYEKPPVSLDHLQQSETYKLIHNMEQPPAKRVDMLTPVIAEADYREKCRSVTPALGVGNHMP